MKKIYFGVCGWGGAEDRGRLKTRIWEGRFIYRYRRFTIARGWPAPSLLDLDELPPISWHVAIWPVSELPKPESPPRPRRDDGYLAGYISSYSSSQEEEISVHASRSDARSRTPRV